MLSGCKCARCADREPNTLGDQSRLAGDQVSDFVARCGPECKRHAEHDRRTVTTVASNMLRLTEAACVRYVARVEIA